MKFQGHFNFQSTYVFLHIGHWFIWSELRILSVLHVTVVLYRFLLDLGHCLPIPSLISSIDLKLNIPESYVVWPSFYIITGGMNIIQVYYRVGKIVQKK